MTTASVSSASIPTERQTVRQTQLILKYLFGLVPIVAGADKFTNLLTHWGNYLNPHLAAIISPLLFMRLVGVIEIVAGILVILRPRLGAYVVMTWLLQLRSSSLPKVNTWTWRSAILSLLWAVP